MCTRVNSDLLTSVLTSTFILHRFHYVVELFEIQIVDLVRGGVILAYLA
jgi:hypothetical protein